MAPQSCQRTRHARLPAGPMTDSGVARPDVATTSAGLAAEAEAWLREHLPTEWVQAVDAGDTAAVSKARRVLDRRAWWREFGPTGYFNATWPVQWGGHGCSGAEARDVRRVLSRFGVPTPLSHASFHVGAALVKWGTDEQRAAHLPKIADQSELWCQMLSEPGAGSDLAGLALAAVRDADGSWVMNGQKVWSSFAHQAQFGLVAARTNPELPKHRGITCFLVDMSTPGVEVRPLRQITGDAEFGEIFFTDARIPAEAHLGPVGSGWQVLMDILSGERASNSGAGGAAHPVVVGRTCNDLVDRFAPIHDDELRDRLVQCLIEERALRLANERIAQGQRQGLSFGTGPALTKLFKAEHIQRLHDLAIDLADEEGTSWHLGDEWWQKTVWSYLRSKAASIGGGTTQIMRTVIGERLLGLPKEPDPFVGAAWRDIPR